MKMFSDIVWREHTSLDTTIRQLLVQSMPVISSTVGATGKPPRLSKGNGQTIQEGVEMDYGSNEREIGIGIWRDAIV